MALATANYFLKWLSRLIPIKRSDALTATLENDSGSIFSVKVGQKRVKINKWHIIIIDQLLHAIFLCINDRDLFYHCKFLIVVT